VIGEGGEERERERVRERGREGELRDTDPFGGEDGTREYGEEKMG